MAREPNHMPPPEPIWVALGLAIWAVAIALGDRRRGLFIDALERVASDQVAKRRIVAVHQPDGRRRAVTASVQVAASYVTRIVAQLRAAHE
jgi:hypothetical protein